MNSSQNIEEGRNASFEGDDDELSLSLLIYCMVCSGTFGAVLTLICYYFYRRWASTRRETTTLRWTPLVRGPYVKTTRYVDEYEPHWPVLKRASCSPTAASRIRTPSSTDDENPPFATKRFYVQADVHRAEESPEVSSPQEQGLKRRQESSSSRKRRRVSSSWERSRESSTQKRRSKSWSPDQAYERSSESSVQVCGSARNAAGQSSQPQPGPSSVLTEGGTYRSFHRSQEAQTLFPPALPSRTSSVKVRTRGTFMPPIAHSRSSPSSLPRPIRPPTASRSTTLVRQPQTPSPRGPLRPKTSERLPQIASSSGLLRQETPGRMSRRSSSAESSRQRTPSEELPTFSLSGELETKLLLSPSSSGKVTHETRRASQLADSDDESEDDEVARIMNPLFRIPTFYPDRDGKIRYSSTV